MPNECVVVDNRILPVTVRIVFVYTKTEGVLATEDTESFLVIWRLVDRIPVSKDFEIFGGQSDLRRHVWQPQLGIGSIPAIPCYPDRSHSSSYLIRTSGWLSSAIVFGVINRKR